MADPDRDVNAGEENTNTPANLRLSPEDQFRALSRRIEDLATEVGRVAKPPTIRGMDIVQIIIIVMGFVAAAITGYGLDTRVSDLRTDVAAAEQRLATAIKDVEARLTAKADKAAGQAEKIDERLSRIEGARNIPAK